MFLDQSTVEQCNTNFFIGDTKIMAFCKGAAVHACDNIIHDYILY